MVNQLIILQANGNRSIGEHWDKLTSHWNWFFPVSLLMLAFFCLGLWWAWLRFKHYFQQLADARAENQDLVTKFDDLVNEQHLMFLELNRDHQKSLRQIDRREEAVKELHCKLADYETSAEENKLKLQQSEQQLSKLGKELKTAQQDDSATVTLKSSLKENEADLKQTQSDKAALEQKVASLEKDIGGRAEEFDALKSINQHLKRENNQFKESGGSDDGDSKRLPQLEAELEEKDDEIAALKRQLNQNQSGQSQTSTSDSDTGGMTYTAASSFAPISAFAGQSVTEDGSLGLLYQSKPSETDDLWEIRGVDEGIEQQLNDEGIYQFKQIALWDDQQQQNVESKLACEGKAAKDHWAQQAADLHFKNTGEQLTTRVSPYQDSASSGGDSEVEQLRSELEQARASLKTMQVNGASAANQLSLDSYEGDVDSDPSLGIVFKSRPDKVDDLKKISGVANVLEGKLNDHGVYQYRQIATWDDDQISEFGERLSFKDRIDRDQWIHQALDLHYGEHGEHLSPRISMYQGSSSSGKSPSASISAFAGEDVTSDNELGIVYQSRPDEVDDLKEISGVAGVLESKLNDHGIYRYKQVATWNDEQIDVFGERLSFKDRIGRDLWVHQAIDLHYLKYGEHLSPNVLLYLKPEAETADQPEIASAEKPEETMQKFQGESVKVDEKFGVIYTEKPDDIDDLKRIKGVGKVLENKLHEFGVYRFKQIALWTPPVVNEFVDNLPFGDRVTRDNWIEQAHEFHENKYGEKVT